MQANARAARDYTMVSCEVPIDGYTEVQWQRADGRIMLNRSSGRDV
jgi:hypothetical protein